jgi:hypothetical protein
MDDKFSLPKEWELILKIAHAIRMSKIPPPAKHMWPIRGLGRRAANLARGLAVVIMHGLWAEGLILGRALMEIEITVKWLLVGDSVARLQRYVNAIHSEEERLCRKLDDGISVSAQFLNELVGEELRTRVKNRSSSGKAAYSKLRWPAASIREMAKEIGLERDYELGYWMESIFAHAHPLSVLEAHPSEWDHILCPLFTCERREGIPRALCLVALPSSVLQTFAAIDGVMKIGLQRELEEAWEAFHALLRDEENGIRWEPSIDVPLGEVHLRLADGTTKRYAPKK